MSTYKQYTIKNTVYFISIYPFSGIDDEYTELIHSTPLFIYKNFDSEYGDLGTQSLNYLTPNVLNELNVKESPFHVLLNTLNNEIKGLTRGNQLDSKGRQIDIFNETNYLALKEYEMIHYDLIAGKKYSEKSGFFKVK
ncbi:hypothetical protein CKN63_00665 [Carnobacterium divergens]|uniref:hypothetical protein n=1 Tax=Carnobacterium divergens TaxID=2748 RepID=UPI00107211A6|nr:hypothetical protein [Carnobacterium divergens]TFI68976.1 hypothetical protein CKN59_00665 [Carnobacterium divergens]TFI69101.1 hypothetical protein CKN76_00665 [Carnobacterium divergens]TFI83936.1 hypothetical protein CKN74_00665 [Carnobacterium divergens]TFJ10180.1 hypothetical protein CKN75_00665 [Carnobacterium divergens]TFJ14899.1 hypothetical protein CKN71_00665 [Carnobacterium divergens]